MLMHLFGEKFTLYVTESDKKTQSSPFRFPKKTTFKLKKYSKILPDLVILELIPLNG